MISRLSPRQKQIAKLISLGLSNKEIAARLSISPGTVANYIHLLMIRLRARNRAQVVTIILHR